VRREALWFAAVLFIYAWFYQGYGYNQDAHFDTARALVEHHAFEITPYWQDEDGPGFTGDVSHGAGGRVYSSKPPGLALVVYPFYAIVHAIERAAGSDVNNTRVATINQQLCTIWGSALPAALLVVALFRYFRSRHLTDADSLLLASGFAFGSLMLPYSGMLMAETLVAACLFAGWRLIDGDPTDIRAALAGALLGLACLAQVSAAPLVPIYLVAAWTRRRRAIIPMLAGPLIALIVQLLYQHAAFGALLASSYSRVDPQYVHQSQLFGHFDWPDIRRLWWLSFHPVRGLLYCCPIFVLPLLALLAPCDRQNSRWHWVVPAAVIANFLLFSLTYSAWTGGWGVGPRYMIPAMPFLMVFAPPARKKFPRISIAADRHLRPEHARGDGRSRAMADRRHPRPADGR